MTFKLLRYPDSHRERGLTGFVSKGREYNSPQKNMCFSNLSLQNTCFEDKAFPSKKVINSWERKQQLSEKGPQTTVEISLNIHALHGNMSLFVCLLTHPEHDASRMEWCNLMCFYHTSCLLLIGPETPIKAHFSTVFKISSF